MDYLKDKFYEDFTATCYQVDRRHILRPAAFLDLAQHMAVFGADKLNFGDEQLGPYGCTWVLARQHVRFERPVMHKESCKVLTWHKCLQGLYFLRDYQILGADGQPAVNSTSSWVVMNIEERRLVRPDFLSEFTSMDPQSKDFAIEAPAGSGTIMLNGPAARNGYIGDKVVIITYANYSDSAAHSHKPTVVKVDDNNRVK